MSEFKSKSKSHSQPAPEVMEHKLVLSGPSAYINYFYESNRINKQDVALFPALYPKQRDLAFDKAIPLLLSNILELNEKHPSTDIWGSYGDAFEVKSKVVAGASPEDPAKLYYVFKTKHLDSTPFQWLRVVSKKYAILDFNMESSDGNSYTIKDGLVKKMRKEGESDAEFLRKSVAKIAGFFGKNKVSDFPKRMKKIYERHAKEAVKSEEGLAGLDYFGVIEDFIEKYDENEDEEDGELGLYDFMSEPSVFGEDLEDLEPLSKEFVEMVIGMGAKPSSA
jgi:hypothetical protein